MCWENFSRFKKNCTNFSETGPKLLVFFQEIFYNFSNLVENFWNVENFLKKFIIKFVNQWIWIELFIKRINEFMNWGVNGNWFDEYSWVNQWVYNSVNW